MIVIVDFGLGNLRSLSYKIQKKNYPCKVSSNAHDIKNAKGLILPGVGHFAEGMKNLKASGLDQLLTEMVIDKKMPVLGICLGMQLLGEHSEEGDVAGLGWIPFSVKRFRPDKLAQPLRVPHVGWSSLNILRHDSPLMENASPTLRYYFTHSFRIPIDYAREDFAVAMAHYGEDFVAVVQKGNVFGTQFHPEKSHIMGMGIVENFIRHATR